MNVSSVELMLLSIVMVLILSSTLVSLTARKSRDRAAFASLSALFVFILIILGLVTLVT